LQATNMSNEIKDSALYQCTKQVTATPMTRFATHYKPLEE